MSQKRPSRTHKRRPSPLSPRARSKRRRTRRFKFVHRRSFGQALTRARVRRRRRFSGQAARSLEARAHQLLSETAASFSRLRAASRPAAAVMAMASVAMRFFARVSRQRALSADSKRSLL